MTRIVLALALGFTALAAFAAPIPKDKLPAPTEKQLEESQNNLKQIGIAIHTYNDTYNAIPANVVDKDGKAILSWRVHLLPYMEESGLYKEFKLDEPWDSKTNKPLIEKMPKEYQPIRVKAEKGHTFYRGFNGPDTVFEAGKEFSLVQVRDGTSNTILVVEAGESCVWTKPDDLPYNAKKPLPKLGGLFDGDFHVLMGDGSVMAGVGSKMDADEFRKLITKSDGMTQDTDLALGIEKKK